MATSRLHSPSAFASSPDQFCPIRKIVEIAKQEVYLQAEGAELTTKVR